jgi:uncharacterized protein YgbK (DUF1537 family)
MGVSLSVTYEWSEAMVEPSRPLVVPGARAAIRASHLRAGRRILVLDDDPTGSQAVHDVEAVMTLDPDAIARALETPGSTCFALTNTRALPEAEASTAARELAGVAAALEQRLGGRIEVVSRSDSTLRGHVMAEITALVSVRRDSAQGYDGVLLVPSYLEAGRFTAANIHWARAGERTVAVGDTEFARDLTFGYSSSDLRYFIEEKSGGAIRAGDVHTISLDDIRRGGPERVKELLMAVHDGAFVVVNCVDYADLDVVVLGLLGAEDEGRAFLYRSGPSFVQALAGIDPIAPLDARAIWRAGPPAAHGLVVVGSHVGLTNRQLEVLEARSRVEHVVIAVDAVVDPTRAAATIAHCAAEVTGALADRDVVLVTGRALRKGHDGEESLQIARSVSRGVVAIVRAVIEHRPAWVITKGGITSHDVLVDALGVKRADVLGQLFAGFVSVFRPLESRPEARGMPCVVFAGNVGGDESLADAVDILRGH